MIANFILTHQKATRVLFVIIPLLLLWTIPFVTILWGPGVLDAIRVTEEASPSVFWGLASAGALSSIYFSYRGMQYLWYWSGNIYTDLESNPG